MSTAVESGRTAGGAEREFAFGDREFRRVCELIRARAGIALNASKRDMVYSRLARRLRALGTSSFAQYLDDLERDGGDEWEHFTNALTTNLTAFYREPHHFEILKKHLEARAKQGGRLRIWCCAASTGEEPYTIAITACEAFGSHAPPVEIVATDLDTGVLATASRGVYTLERVEKLPLETKREYFLRGAGPHDGECRVRPFLRELVQFRPLNLLDRSYASAVDGTFDAVFCRNVMIYFDKQTQYDILSKIKPMLKKDALFFAGHSESFFHATDLIRSIGRTVYVRADAAPGIAA